MEYDIKKDAKPQDTVERIKSILDKAGIETVAFCTGCGKNYYSVRVNIKGTDIGTNGKGTCEINALASGYAEFMERLQSQYLLLFNGKNNFFFQDEKLLSYNQLNDPFTNYILKTLKLNEETLIKICKVTNTFFTNFKNKNKLKDKIVNIPFMSFKNKNEKYFSLSVLNFFQGSNGLAAGNTYEEACVQALSEILERYCQKEIFTKQIKIPEIPKKYYKKYKTLISLINEIENLGYKITVKDASLGKNFPTVCCLIEDLKCSRNGTCVKFGAHPYFPVALERTLTEFMQGLKRDDLVKKYNMSTEKIIEGSFLKTTFICKKNKNINFLFAKKGEYSYKKTSWLTDKNCNNRKMFNYLAKIILKHADDIYIRNYSFLEFPVVQIHIPEMSSYFILNKEYVEKNIDFLQWQEYAIEEKFPKNSTILDFFDTCKFMLNKRIITNTKKALNIPAVKYYGFYSSIILNNKKYIKKFLRRILYDLYFEFINNKSALFLRLYQGFNKYFELSWKNFPEEKIKEKIEKQYSSEIYNEIIKTLETISWEKIKASLAAKDDKDEFENIREKIEKLEIKLCELYQNNIPNQNEIIKIIDPPSIFKKIYNKLCPHK